ncbi:MAG TPA: glycosyltransferase family 39 protein, partial [Phycisphaerales bacterium]|nr:glycosyltransferase family 39 protein [Phycisphaerales bacterium]
AGVARAYARGETGFLHPVVEWRGDTPGTAETEFPLYAYTAGLAQRALGFHPWVPRALSVFAGLATLWLAYLLVRLRSGTDVAGWSLAVLALLPLVTFFSRTIQPESWMHAAFVGSIYCMARWSAGAPTPWLFASAAAAALTILLKLPSAVIGLPLAVLVLERRGWRGLGSPLPWMAATLALAPAALWYTHAHRLGAGTGLSFGVLGSDKWGTLTALPNPAWWRNVFVGKLAEDHLAVVGGPLALLGLCASRREPSERVFDAWSLAMLAHILLIPVGHAVHDYYQLPLSVPLAFYIGRFLARGPLGPRPALARAACVAALALGSAHTLARLYRKELRHPLPEIELAAALRGATTPGDLVLVFVQAGHRDDPTVLYLADRKGWTVTPEQASPALVADLSRRGACAAAVSRQLTKDEDRFRAIVSALGGAGDPAPDVVVRRLGGAEPRDPG